MGNCESNCFTYYNPQGAVTINGNQYSHCGQNPPILNVSFNPINYGSNGSTSVVLSDNSGNGANIATLVFSGNVTSNVITNVGVTSTRDADENIELILLSPKIQNLVAGKDYIIGDTYKIRIPENAFCTGNQNGAFMVFSRGSGDVNHALAIIHDKKHGQFNKAIIKESDAFKEGVRIARAFGGPKKKMCDDNVFYNYAALFALLAMIIAVLCIIMKRK